MKKKFFIGLAPLLVLALFAATGAGVQASGGPNRGSAFTATGTLTLTNSTLGTLECHSVTFSGSTEGSKPVGNVRSFTARECVSPTCETLGGKASKLSAEGLPWNAEVVQPEGGDGRFKLGFKGTERNKKPTAPGFVALKFTCKGVAEPVFFGEVSPKILNGGAELEFDPGSGELESESFGPALLKGKFKVEGLKVTPTPGYKIEKQQEIEGSKAGFTTSPVTGKIGQTVDYKIIVTNTGGQALTFTNFTDPKCEGIAGGPTGPVAAGESTTFTCHQVLKEVGSYTNSASITGNEGTGTKTSNTVEAKVASEPAYSIEKQQEIEGSKTGFTTAPLAAKAGETVDYRIIVTNTGNVSLTFTNFTDAKCEGIAGGPTGPVAPGESTTFTCHHLLTETNTYTNSATITGTEGTGTKTSNTVEVTPALGEVQHYTASGTLKLRNSTLSEVECRGVVFTGTIESRTNAGQVQTFTVKECTSPGCIALGGTAVEVTAEKLPWTDAITEPEAGVKRLKLGFKGKERNREPSEPGFVALRENCVGVISALFFGETSPKILNGGAELEFDQPGSGELESEAVGAGTLIGKFKVEGLTVK